MAHQGRHINTASSGKEVLLIDNFDSFTWNIVHYLEMSGLACHLMRDNEPVMKALQEKEYDGIVLSPGPMRPKDHPAMFDILEKYIEKKPVLGICLGHQAIGEFFGARLVKAPKPVHGKVSEITHSGHPMYMGIPEKTDVARYHSLVLQDIDEGELTVTATAENGLPMSLAHKFLPVWGMQFHPEAIQTAHGLQMVKNWASIFS